MGDANNRGADTTHGDFGEDDKTRKLADRLRRQRSLSLMRLQDMSDVQRVAGSFPCNSPRISRNPVKDFRYTGC
ncbi:protein of unknown function [Candidatus Methylomirabilis oxygeniifera]|uniref:Uncharacterized protein n=1 Tax=Methylomirabilis oxygeniifera TaxID=671143 RepID=D5MF36_METO1|nr:protein of unknown function [Candidatus Methylomirabilis oxyfera]